MTGTLNSSFSNDGKAVYTFGGNDYGMALARQADGKLIVVGYTDQDAAPAIPRPTTASRSSRVDTDGTLDATFNKVTVASGSDNGNGRVLIDFGFDATATAVAIQPNGKIVVLGTSTSGDASMAIARLDADEHGDRTPRSRATASEPSASAPGTIPARPWPSSQTA